MGWPRLWPKHDRAGNGRPGQSEAADRVLVDSELRYRLLAEQSPDIIVRYDVDGWIDYISPAIRRYGAEPSQIIGRNFADVVDPGDRERNAAWMADLAAGRAVPQGALNVWRIRIGDRDVQPSDVERRHSAGMNDHLPKPISAQDFLIKVTHWLAQGSTAAA